VLEKVRSVLRQPPPWIGGDHVAWNSSNIRASVAPLDAFAGRPLDGEGSVDLVRFLGQMVVMDSCPGTEVRRFHILHTTETL
jgi:hypothetical protein